MKNLENNIIIESIVLHGEKLIKVTKYIDSFHLDKNEWKIDA